MSDALFVYFCDYSDYHKKESTLAALRKKALEKNPDEFYHKMISSKLEVIINTFQVLSCVGLILTIYFLSFFLQDGVHTITNANEEVEVTEEQKKMMRTQDIRYVEMKRVAEAKVR